MGYKAVLERIDLANRYNFGEIYSRHYPQKAYFLKPLKSPQKDTNRLMLFLEMAKEFYGGNFNYMTIEDNFDEDEILGFADIGVMAQHSPGKTEDFAFIEIPKSMIGENCIPIPAGTYFFRHDQNSQFENALQIFEKHLVGVDKFMITEVEEPLLSKNKFNQPAYELRLIIL